MGHGRWQAGRQEWWRKERGGGVCREGRVQRSDVCVCVCECECESVRSSEGRGTEESEAREREGGGEESDEDEREREKERIESSSRASKGGSCPAHAHRRLRAPVGMVNKDAPERE